MAVKTEPGLQTCVAIKNIPCPQKCGQFHKEHTMIANYHTHTVRCRHASGTEEEYIQAAIDRGLQICGFSDHAPQYFPGSYYSHMRMYPQELQDYCDGVRQLQQRYQEKIQIPLGMEVENYPDLLPELLPRLRDQGVQYMILGQHWIGNEENEPYSGTPTEDENVLRRYCRQVCDAMETGCFTYLAHPGLIHFTGDPKIFEKHMRTLCRVAKETATPLELNFLGLATGRQYPNPRLWALAGEEGCDAVFGIDAHDPQSIRELETEKKALALVRQYGLNLLETVPLKTV